jgi:hypothetical protein
MFGAGDNASATCLLVKGGTPVLSIDDGPVSLTIFPSSGGQKLISPGNLRFARELVEQAGVFLAEVERMHAEQQADEQDQAEAA